MGRGKEDGAHRTVIGARRPQRLSRATPRDIEQRRGDNLVLVVSRGLELDAIQITHEGLAPAGCRKLCGRCCATRKDDGAGRGPHGGEQEVPSKAHMASPNIGANYIAPCY